MSGNSEISVESLNAAPLLSFELVFADDDFFVAVNGDCLPSSCDGYSLNEAGCFVLRQGPVEFVSHPMPAPLIPLLTAPKEVLFVQFLSEQTVDMKSLQRFS